ncbi:MAG: YdeI/OmpD-associated family protein [Myxococcota bacterium]
MSERLEVEVKSRKALRAWLSKHHAQPDSVWMVHHKKVSSHYVPMGELVSELLCWGWVDSVSRGVDETRTSHLIAPRNPKSAWSAVNKAKVEEARAAGLMTDAGEAAIAVAQKNGMWSFLDDVERLEVPDDLNEALGPLREVWDAYPRNVKRGTLEWLKTAKTAPTRQKRIAGITTNARAQKRPPPFER